MNRSVVVRFQAAFALLDLSCLFTSVPHWPDRLNMLLRGDPLAITLCLANVLVLFSLLAWWSGHPLRFALSYVLFPLRIAFALLSFAWLADFALVLLPSGPRLDEAVWLVAIVLEGVRLGITIMLHMLDRCTFNLPFSKTDAPCF